MADVGLLNRKMLKLDVLCNQKPIFWKITLVFLFTVLNDNLKKTSSGDKIFIKPRIFEVTTWNVWKWHFFSTSDVSLIVSSLTCQFDTFELLERLDNFNLSPDPGSATGTL